jgi:hypothetical protein
VPATKAAQQAAKKYPDFELQRPLGKKYLTPFRAVDNTGVWETGPGARLRCFTHRTEVTAESAKVARRDRELAGGAAVRNRSTICGSSHPPVLARRGAVYW